MAACHCSGCCRSWCPPYISTSKKRPQCAVSCATFGSSLRLNGLMSIFFPSGGPALLQRIHILRCFRVTWYNHSICQTAHCWAFAPFRCVSRFRPLKSTNWRIWGHTHFQYGHRRKLKKIRSLPLQLVPLTRQKTSQCCDLIYNMKQLQHDKNAQKR